MASEKYWMRRSLANSAKAFNLGEEKLRKLKKEYEKAVKTVEKEIEQFYRRFATEEGISLSKAKKTLKSSQLQVDLDEYLRLAKLTGDPQAKTLLKKAGTKARFNRLEELKLSLEKEITRLFGTEQQMAREVLADAYEGAYYRNIYELQRGMGTGREFEILTPRAVDRAISTAWSGEMYSARIWKHRKLLAKKMEQTITQGVILGHSNQKMARKLGRAMEVSYSDAKRLIRTETNYVYNQATARSYEETGLERYIYLATLDLRTSEVCGALDGEKFRIKEAQTGKNYPPLHPNCRSTTIPDVDGAQDGTRLARGENKKSYKVPADKSYQEWYNKYVRKRLPKVAPAPDAVLQKRISFGRGERRSFIPLGAEIKDVHVIAGKGTSTKLRSREALARTYGGSPDDWQKKAGRVVSDRYEFDIHFVEAEGVGQFEQKIKHRKERDKK